MGKVDGFYVLRLARLPFRHFRSGEKSAGRTNLQYTNSGFKGFKGFKGFNRFKGSRGSRGSRVQGVQGFGLWNRLVASEHLRRIG